MKRGVLIAGAVVVTAAMAAAGVFIARHDWLVEDLMGQVHIGPSSPYERLNAQATAAAPEWSNLEVILPPLDEMCRALVTAKDGTIRQSAGGYVDAVERLRRAITGRELALFREASQDLRKSCGDCHAPGGVGGVLPAR